MWSSAEWLVQRPKLAAERVHVRTLDHIGQAITHYHGCSGTQVQERIAILEELLRLASPFQVTLSEEQERIVKACERMTPNNRAVVLQSKGIALREGVAALLDQVTRELALIRASQDRWAGLRRLYVFERREDSSPVPGPVLRIEDSGYQREVYDPLHRPWGQDNSLQESWSATSSTHSLFEYADRKGYDKRVTYLSPTETEARKIVFREGRLYLGDTLYDSSQDGEGWSMFVMDQYGNFFVGEHQEMVFHHSSLLRGSPLKGAGQLKVKQGILRSLSDRSGHYKPGPEHMFTVVNVLRRWHGVPLENVVVEIYERDGSGHLIPGLSGFESKPHSALSLLGLKS